jgi:hypothetical protein
MRRVILVSVLLSAFAAAGCGSAAPQRPSISAAAVVAALRTAAQPYGAVTAADQTDPPGGVTERFVPCAVLGLADPAKDANPHTEVAGRYLSRVEAGPVSYRVGEVVTDLRVSARAVFVTTTDRSVQAVAKASDLLHCHEKVQLAGATGAPVFGLREASGVTVGGLPAVLVLTTVMADGLQPGTIYALFGHARLIFASGPLTLDAAVLCVRSDRPATAAALAAEAKQRAIDYANAVVSALPATQ